MDDETTSLVGEYGHCAQELVNLMITGRCITNVGFDRWVIRRSDGFNTVSISLLFGAGF